MANGYIFYEDDSIVGIITGLMLDSDNTKTGAMPQTWILVKDINPIEAVNTGADKLICGDCKHRGAVVSVDEKRDKKSYSVRNGLKTINKQRKCYVKLFQAPYIVWKSYKKGNYKQISLQKLSKLLAFKKVRVGSYGDPAVIPSEVWDKMLSRTLGNTGYTHQWQKCDNNNSRFNMASVDSLEEKRQANKLGYRTFRTRLASEPIEPDEVVCLSDKKAREGKKLVSCADCMMCSGTSSKVKKNITIIIH